MRAIFLADAHLSKPADPNYRALLAFLEEQCGKVDLLVLLGDIFEFWIGKAKVVADYVPLIDCLERLRHQGTRLVYVEGNHDFHLGPVFTRRLGCQVFPDGGAIELDGLQVFLTHGDLANPDDVSYRLLRKMLRNGLLQRLIRVIPSGLSMAIANRASFESRKNSAERHLRWPARTVLQPFVQAILAKGYQAVVTGHYHQPYHEKIGDGEHIALGDWITQYSYAVYEDRVFSLHNYSAEPAATSGASC
jgi:UDP-2,3-diacylglucosamine hydrolase